MTQQPRTEFYAALNQVATERNLDIEVVLEAIKAAILAAYRKDYAPESLEGIEAQLDSRSGEVKLLQDAKDITPSGFGRIAAQTAKQVILQRIREAEKTAILVEFEKKIGMIVNGMVQRIEGHNVYVDLGKTDALMPSSEQVPGEHYRSNQRLVVYIVGIQETGRGPVVIVSRSAKELVAGLFRREVPEIASGSVEIKVIAREAGARTKIAVWSNQTGVDPVGSCVGQRGIRVQQVIAELNDEKIDVIAYNPDPQKFIAASLAPAKDVEVRVNADEQSALVVVPDDQLSLAIGREGQNVRLASRLTGYKLDIRGKSQLADAVQTEDVKHHSDSAQKKTRKSKKSPATEGDHSDVA